MLLYNVFTSRRTIHQYRPEPVSREEIFQAIEVGAHAMNHKNTQPWRFTLVGDRSRQKIFNLNIQIRSETKSLSLTEKEALNKQWMSSSYLIVVSQVRSSDPFQEKEDYAAVACALQSMSLFLWPKNIGTKWSTGKVTRHRKTYEILSIPQNKEIIVGFFWLGRPLVIPKVKAKSQIQDIVREID